MFLNKILPTLLGLAALAISCSASAQILEEGRECRYVNGTEGYAGYVEIIYSFYFSSDYKIVEHGTYTHWRVDSCDDEYLGKRLEVEYYHGKMNGTKMVWYENGNVFSQTGYKDGKLHGKEMVWSEGGVMESQKEYRDGQKHGVHIEYYADGQPKIQREYRYDLKHGLQIEWNTNGFKTSETNYGKNKRNGYEWRWYEDSEQLMERTHYVDDWEVGPYVSWTEDNQVETLGQHCCYYGGYKCGVWEYPLEDRISTYSACDPYEIIEEMPAEILANPYPQLVEDGEGSQKGIRGHIRTSEEGRPLEGVTIAAGGIQASSDADGFYSLVVGQEDTIALECTKDGFHTYSREINLEGLEYKTINITLKPDVSGEKPVITNVESRYGEIFLDGIAVNNEYQVSVDWNGDPGSIEFDVNGTVTDVGAAANGASHVFNMGSDFTSGISSETNTLRITAVNGASIESDPEILHPIVIPIPQWSLALGSFGDIEYGKGVITYKLEKNWPEEALEFEINEKTLGLLWPAWSLMPLVGGRVLGIPASQAFLGLEVKTDGTGSVSAGGKTGFGAAGLTIEGKLGGKGLLQYKTDSGLIWKGASLLLGVKGSIEKEVGPVTLIPALEGSVNLPIVGRAIGWFNKKAIIKGTVSTGTNIDLQVISETGGIGFHKSEGDINTGLGLALSVDIMNNVKAEVSGSGTTKVVYQVPAAPDYLKKIETELLGKVSIQAWLFATNLEKKHTFTYPSQTTQDISERRALAEPLQDLGFQPISRDFINNVPYSNFIAGATNRTTRTTRSADSTDGLEETIIENIYPHSQPALTENAGNIGIAFVYFDPQDPTLQATEIYFTYYNGQSYTTPGPILNDTRAEFSPTLAFDSNGKIVCVWERVNTVDLTSENMVDMARALEIVYAVYDPIWDTWTAPVSLTDNDFLDHSPMLKKGPYDTLLLVWQSNQGNELIGDTESPTTIHYATWDGEGFSSVDTLTDMYENCFKFSFASNGYYPILSYTRDMDGDLSTTEDLEVFIIMFNEDIWGWGDPIQITSNEVPDVNLKIIYRQDGIPELIWLTDDTLIRYDAFDTEIATAIREASNSITFTDFKVVSDDQDHLVLLWQNKDEKGVDLFYSVYDPDNSIWSKDLRLTEDNEMEKDFAGAFTADGVLHLVYTKENLDTQATDLNHMHYSLSSDLGMVAGGLTVTPQGAAPGDTVSLSCKVSNGGDLAVSNVQVAFYQGDPDEGGQLLGTTEVTPGTLKAGDEGEAALSWTIPADMAAYDVFAVVDPDNVVPETDETNNSTSFAVLKPDLEAKWCKLEKHKDGSIDITAVIHNNGIVPATDVEIWYKASGRDLGLIKIPRILPGKTSEVTHLVWVGLEFFRGEPEIEIEIDPAQKIAETNEDNNKTVAFLTLATLSQESLDFGEFDVNQTSTQTFTLTNTGNGDLTLGSITVSGASESQFNIESDGCADRLLKPSESCTVEVAFSPTIPGIKIASLSILSRDQSVPLLTLPLSGNALSDVIIGGDINSDGDVNLMDAILAFQILDGILPANISTRADVNGDGKIGLEEAIYCLQLVAGFR